MTSKKMLATILVLVGILILSIISYFAVDAVKTAEEKKTAEEEALLTLYDFDSDTVTKVEFDTVEGYFCIESVDGYWELTDTDYPYTFILDTDYITSVCTYFSTLVADKIYDRGDNAWSNYGLDDPVTLTLTTSDGEMYSLAIGNMSQTTEYFYAKKADSDTLYAIAYEYGALFYGDTSYLKSSYLLSFSDVYITAMSLVSDGEYIYDLECVDGTWVMYDPLPNASIDSSTVKSLLTTLTRYEVESYVEVVTDSTRLADYGLDDPAYTLTVKQDNDTITLKFATWTDEDSEVYVLREEDGEIALVSTSTASFLYYNAEDMLKSQILDITTADVASLAVVIDDVTFYMDLDTENEVYSFEGLNISDLGDTIVSNFTNLYNACSALVFETMDLDSDLSTIDPEADSTARFIYTYEDGSTTVLQLVPIDDLTYWAYVDGEYTGVTVRKRSLSTSTGVLYHYEKLLDSLEDAA